MWTRYTPPILLCLVASVAWAQPAPISREEVAEHGYVVASYEAPDAFSEAPSEEAVIGRTFRIVRPLAESEAPNITHIVGGWTYDLRSQRLRVAIPTSGWTAAALPDAEMDQFMHRGFTVGSRNLSNTTYEAQNAFGVSTNVQSLVSQTVRIGSLTRESRGRSVVVEDNMYADVTLAPDAARAATTDATYIIEGTIEAISPGRATLCSESASEATLDLPLETLIRTCTINAVLTRVAIQGGDGAILAEWLPTGAAGSDK